MKDKMKTCKTCGAQIAKNAKFCPQCGGKNKKPIYKKWWFWVIIGLILLGIFSGGGKKEKTEENNAEQIDNAAVTNDAASSKETEEQAEKSAEENAPADKEAEKEILHVGDEIEDGNLKIVYIASGDYQEDNQFLEAEEGFKHIFLKFAFENTSDKSDCAVSSFSFKCYADGYAADSFFGGDEDLSATLSAGRSTVGCVYFTVPEDAEEVEVEYEANVFTERKIFFAFEGEKDSGYVIESKAQASADAYQVGEVAESSSVNITYLSCEDYTSDNMFVQPKDGCHFVRCEFEFENVSSSDEFVSSLDFDCYADGLDCAASYMMDDELNATISAGRKAKGAVYFEVPDEAEVVEVEYLSNIWTSNRVVFTVK